MKISIITVCWNSEKTIRDAMASVAAQKDAEVEYLVIDGGSTDGTVDAIREFEKSHPSSSSFVFRWLSEQDNGMYDAMNKGVQLATGEVVGILNSDDMLDGPEVLKRVGEAFRSADVDCRFGNVRFAVDGKTTRVCFARWWRPWMLQWGYMPPHPGIFIRRKCFETWGGYVGNRNEYRIAADYELLIRFFRKRRMSHRYMKLCTTVMRTGGVSTNGVDARKLLNREIIKANRVNGYFCCWPMLLPKYAIKVWEFIIPRLARNR